MSGRKSVEMPDADTGSGTALATLTSDAPSTTATIDPRLLTIGANVRADADLTPEFVGSIREHGVRVPVLVTRDVLDQVHVLDGQRRTLAAIEAGLTQVPIAWVDGVGDDETRIIDQLVINDHRSDLRTTHRTTAYEQLSFMGRSAETIARRAGRPVEEVTAALAVAESKAASAAAAAYPTMPLDVQAAIAEFDGDSEAVETITADFERRGDARHAIAQARSNRDEREMVAARVAELVEQGVAAVVVIPESAEGLVHLTDEPGAEGYPPHIDEEKHAAECPQHAMRVFVSRAWSDVRYVPVVAEKAYCLDWKSAGHHKRDARNTAGATSGPKSDEEKAARRELVANNKVADVERETRHAFLVEFLKRKTIPAEYVELVALTLAVQYSHINELSEAWALVGSPVAGAGREHVEQRLAVRRTSQAFLLALAFARIEATLPRDYHRNPKNFGLLRPYFEQLVAWGYVLGDVEKAALKGSRKRSRR